MTEYGWMKCKSFFGFAKSDSKRSEMMRNQKIKKTLFFTAAASMLLSGRVLASPPFARTEQEWQSLRDNKLEYAEIRDLIHEYNASVRQNNIDLSTFKKDYGRTNSKVSDAYREMANDILSNITEPDPDSMFYASAAAAALQARTQADNLMKTADETLEDAEIFRLNYENAEMQLVQSAQNNMISYYDKLLALDKAKSDHETAKLDFDISKIRLNAGMATRMDVLSAEETVLKSEQEIRDAESEANTVKQILMLSCGWSYNASPEFGELPKPDLARIETMNPELDREKAWENNYTLRVNLRKLENAKTQDQKDKLDQSIANNRNNISASLTEAYRNVIAARDAYTYAKSNLDLQEKNLETAKHKSAVGMISRVELSKAEAESKAADIAYRRSELALLQAINAYDWTLAGLAKAD